MSKSYLKWPKIFINVEFKNEVIDIVPLFPKVWTVLNVHSLAFNVQSPAPRVKSPVSRIQGPASSIQGLPSRIQRPTIASRIKEFRYASVNFIWNQVFNNEINMSTESKQFSV